MRILTKLKFRFRNGKETFVSKGQNLIEDAPDWIEKDGMFDLAVKDGSLVKLDTTPIVQGSSPVKEVKPEPAEVQKPKAAPAKKAPAKKTAARKK